MERRCNNYWIHVLHLDDRGFTKKKKEAKVLYTASGEICIQEERQKVIFYQNTEKGQCLREETGFLYKDGNYKPYLL